jgi:hypothetical protein
MNIVHFEHCMKVKKVNIFRTAILTFSKICSVVEKSPFAAVMIFFISDIS